MADIFVSYAREDEGRIAALVQLLEAQGLSIFWDRHIPPGKSWRDHIGQALADARCVIVVWSHHSIVSSFVAEEADDARVRGILVPVMIDSVMPPLGFRSVQAADLADLGSDAVPAGFDTLLAAVRSSIGGATPRVAQRPPAAAAASTVQGDRHRSRRCRKRAGRLAGVVAICRHRWQDSAAASCRGPKRTGSRPRWRGPRFGRTAGCAAPRVRRHRDHGAGDAPR